MPFDSNQALQLPQKRRRTPRSCQECRRGKTKCDQKAPCSHCVLMKKSCLYHAPPTPTWSTSTAAPAVTSTTKHPGSGSSQTVINEIVQMPSSAPISVSTTQLSMAAHPSCSPQLGRGSDKEYEVIELRHRVRKLEQVLIKSGRNIGDEAVQIPAPSAASEHHDTPHESCGNLTLNKSRLFGRSHWSNSSAVEVGLTRAILRLACSTPAHDSSFKG